MENVTIPTFVWVETKQKAEMLDNLIGTMSKITQLPVIQQYTQYKELSSIMTTIYPNAKIEENKLMPKVLEPDDEYKAELINEITGVE